MDALSEFCAIKNEEYLTGTYYERLPKTTKDYGEPFSYKVLDPRTREFKTLIGNLAAVGANLAIKTRSSLDFKVKSHIVTQDGKMWQIAATVENVESEQSREALRFFNETAQTEKTIRLVGVANTMSLI